MSLTLSANLQAATLMKLAPAENLEEAPATADVRSARATHNLDLSLLRRFSGQPFWNTTMKTTISLVTALLSWPSVALPAAPNAAAIRDVASSAGFNCAFTSAPLAINTATKSALPLRAARCRIVAPFSS